jgi:hypothetical protein
VFWFRRKLVEWRQGHVLYCAFTELLFFSLHASFWTVRYVRWDLDAPGNTSSVLMSRFFGLIRTRIITNDSLVASVNWKRQDKHRTNDWGKENFEGMLYVTKQERHFIWACCKSKPKYFLKAQFSRTLKIKTRTSTILDSNPLRASPMYPYDL